MTAVAGLTSNDAAREAFTRNRFSEMSSEEFVKIMVEELSNQDPFQPNDSAAVLEQISSIRNIEAQGSLEKSLKGLVSQNAVTQSSAMIGHWVAGRDAKNAAVEGMVTSVRLENGSPILKLSSGKELPFANVTTMEQGGDVDAAIIQQLLSSLAILDSSNLVGKMVTGKDENGKAVSGLVTRVDVEENGQIFLELDTGKQLRMDKVTSFSTPAVGGGDSTPAG